MLRDALARSFGLLVAHFGDEEEDWPASLLAPLRNALWVPARRVFSANHSNPTLFVSPKLCFSDVVSVLGARLPGGEGGLLGTKLSLLCGGYFEGTVAGVPAKDIGTVLKALGMVGGSGLEEKHQWVCLGFVRRWVRNSRLSFFEELNPLGAIGEIHFGH